MSKEVVNLNIASGFRHRRDSVSGLSDSQIKIPNLSNSENALGLIISHLKGSKEDILELTRYARATLDSWGEYFSLIAKGSSNQEARKRSEEFLFNRVSVIRQDVGENSVLGKDKELLQLSNLKSIGLSISVLPDAFATPAVMLLNIAAIETTRVALNKLNVTDNLCFDDYVKQEESDPLLRGLRVIRNLGILYTLGGFSAGFRLIAGMTAAGVVGEKLINVGKEAGEDKNVYQLKDFLVEVLNGQIPDEILQSMVSSRMFCLFSGLSMGRRVASLYDGVDSSKDLIEAGIKAEDVGYDKICLDSLCVVRAIGQVCLITSALLDIVDPADFSTKKKLESLDKRCATKNENNDSLVFLGELSKDIEGEAKLIDPKTAIRQVLKLEERDYLSAQIDFSKYPPVAEYQGRAFGEQKVKYRLWDAEHWAELNKIRGTNRFAETFLFKNNQDAIINIVVGADRNCIDQIRDLYEEQYHALRGWQKDGAHEFVAKMYAEARIYNRFKLYHVQEYQRKTAESILEEIVKNYHDNPEEIRRATLTCVSLVCDFNQPKFEKIFYQAPAFIKDKLLLGINQANQEREKLGWPKVCLDLLGNNSLRLSSIETSSFNRNSEILLAASNDRVIDIDSLKSISRFGLEDFKLFWKYLERSNLDSEKLTLADCFSDPEKTKLRTDLKNQSEYTPRYLDEKINLYFSALKLLTSSPFLINSIKGDIHQNLEIIAEALHYSREIFLKLTLVFFASEGKTEEFDLVQLFAKKLKFDDFLRDSFFEFATLFGFVRQEDRYSLETYAESVWTILRSKENPKSFEPLEVRFVDLDEAGYFAQNPSTIFIPQKALELEQSNVQSSLRYSLNGDARTILFRNGGYSVRDAKMWTNFGEEAYPRIQINGGRRALAAIVALQSIIQNRPIDILDVGSGTASNWLPILKNEGEAINELHLTSLSSVFDPALKVFDKVRMHLCSLAHVLKRKEIPNVDLIFSILAGKHMQRIELEVVLSKLKLGGIAVLRYSTYCNNPISVEELQSLQLNHPELEISIQFDFEYGSPISILEISKKVVIEEAVIVIRKNHFSKVAKPDASQVEISFSQNSEANLNAVVKTLGIPIERKKRINLAAIKKKAQIEYPFELMTTSLDGETVRTFHYGKNLVQSEQKLALEYANLIRVNLLGSATVALSDPRSEDIIAAQFANSKQAFKILSFHEGRLVGGMGISFKEADNLAFLHPIMFIDETVVDPEFRNTRVVNDLHVKGLYQGILRIINDYGAKSNQQLEFILSSYINIDTALMNLPKIISITRTILCMLGYKSVSFHLHFEDPLMHLQESIDVSIRIRAFKEISSKKREINPFTLHPYSASIPADLPTFPPKLRPRISNSQVFLKYDSVEEVRQMAMKLYFRNLGINEPNPHQLLIAQQKFQGLIAFTAENGRIHLPTFEAFAAIPQLQHLIEKDNDRNVISDVNLRRFYGAIVVHESTHLSLKSEDFDQSNEALNEAYSMIAAQDYLLQRGLKFKVIAIDGINVFTVSSAAESVNTIELIRSKKKRDSFFEERKDSELVLSKQVEKQTERIVMEGSYRDLLLELQNHISKVDIGKRKRNLRNIQEAAIEKALRVTAEALRIFLGMSEFEEITTDIIDRRLRVFTQEDRSSEYFIVVNTLLSIKKTLEELRTREDSSDINDLLLKSFKNSYEIVNLLKNQNLKSFIYLSLENLASIIDFQSIEKIKIKDHISEEFILKIIIAAKCGHPEALLFLFEKVVFYLENFSVNAKNSDNVLVQIFFEALLLFDSRGNIDLSQTKKKIISYIRKMPILDEILDKDDQVPFKKNGLLANMTALSYYCSTLFLQMRSSSIFQGKEFVIQRVKKFNEIFNNLNPASRTDYCQMLRYEPLSALAVLPFVNYGNLFKAKEEEIDHYILDEKYSRECENILASIDSSNNDVNIFEKWERYFILQFHLGKDHTEIIETMQEKYFLSLHIYDSLCIYGFEKLEYNKSSFNNPLEFSLVVTLSLFQSIFFDSRQKVSILNDKLEESRVDKQFCTIERRVYFSIFKYILSSRNQELLLKMARDDVLKERLLTYFSTGELAALYLNEEKTILEKGMAQDGVSLEKIKQILQYYFGLRLNYAHASRDALAYLDYQIKQPCLLYESEILQLSALSKINELRQVLNAQFADFVSQTECKYFVSQMAKVLEYYDFGIRSLMAWKMIAAWFNILENEDARIGEFYYSANAIKRKIRAATDYTTSVFLGLSKILRFESGKLILTENAKKYFESVGIDSQELSELIEVLETRGIWDPDKFVSKEEIVARYAVINVSAFERSERFLSSYRKDVTSNFFDLSLGSRDCLAFYTYHLFFMNHSEEEVLLEFNKLVLEIAEEEKKMKEFQTPIGLEVNIRPDYEKTINKTFSWLSFLNIFNMISIDNHVGHRSQTIEVGLRPTYSLKAVRLFLDNFLELLDATSILNPCPVHINLGGFSGELTQSQLDRFKYLLFILFLKPSSSYETMLQQKEVFEETYDNSDLLTGNTRAAITLQNSQVDDILSIQFPRRVSLRLARLEMENSNGAIRVTEESFEKLRDAWIMAIAFKEMNSARSTGVPLVLNDTLIQDPSLVRGFINDFQQIIHNVPSKKAKKGIFKLIDLYWVHTSFGFFIKTRFLNALWKVVKEMSNSPSLADELYDQFNNLLKKYADIFRKNNGI